MAVSSLDAGELADDVLEALRPRVPRALAIRFHETNAALILGVAREIVRRRRAAQSPGEPNVAAPPCSHRAVGEPFQNKLEKPMCSHVVRVGVAFLLLGRLTSAYAQISFGGGDVSVNIGGGNVTVGAGGVGVSGGGASASVGPYGVNVSSGGTGIGLGPGGTSVRLPNADTYVTIHGVSVRLPGGSTSSFDGQGFHVNIPGVGSGTISPRGVISIPGVGAFGPDGINGPDGRPVFNYAPDGFLKPANWSDADWFAALNPSAQNIQETFASDQETMEAQLRADWDIVIFGTDIDYEQYSRLAAAIALAVSTADPAPVLTYFQDLLDQIRDDLVNNASQSLQELGDRLDAKFLYQTFNDVVNSGNPKIMEILNFKVVAGVNVYYHSKRISFDAPTTSGFVNRVVNFAGPNTYRPYIGVKFPTNQPGSTASQIGARFRNETNATVRFSLNGGGGLTTDLPAGDAREYNVVVDPGVAPAVSIFQPGGGQLSFYIEQGGRYAFRVDGNTIKNFYDTNPAQPNRTMWTGSFQGNSTLFKQVGAAWQEFQNGSTTPTFSFIQTGADANYVYLLDSSRNMRVALGDGAMYWRANGGGQWNAMYTGGWGTVD